MSNADISPFANKSQHDLKQELLKLMLSKKGIEVNTKTIPRRDSSASVSLSWAQERLWFLEQLEGGSATYNERRVICLNGDLDISALEKSLDEIVRRHEVLRTSFASENGKPRQVIHPDISLKLEIVDLQSDSEAVRETKLQQLVNEAARTPFNLEMAPLVRCSLLQLDTRKYLLLVTMHHIISDGWSLGVLIEELSSLYQAFVRGEISPLEELPIQYADFALWQRDWLSGEKITRQIDYWKQQLEQVPELIKLPTDHPRPAVQSYRGATKSFSISAELSEQLQLLSQKSGVTLFMTLQIVITVKLSH